MFEIANPIWMQWRLFCAEAIGSVEWSTGGRHTSRHACCEYMEPVGASSALEVHDLCTCGRGTLWWWWTCGWMDGLMDMCDGWMDFVNFMWICVICELMWCTCELYVDLLMDGWWTCGFMWTFVIYVMDMWEFVIYMWSMNIYVNVCDLWIYMWYVNVYVLIKWRKRKRKKIL